MLRIRSVTPQYRFMPILLFLLMWTLPITAEAQVLAQWGSVSGTVVSENDDPLQGATVQLFTAGSNMARYGSTTNEAGAYSISRVAPGAYEAWVSFIGYGTRRFPVTVAANQQSELNAVLSSVAIPHDEVVVSTGRAREQLSPVTFSNISAEDLARQPDMKDLPVLLARQPSITLYSENGNAIGYSTLRMRGFDQRRLAVAINGIPQNDPEEFNVFWINFFDIQGAAQDIQIQRGAGSSVYGPTAIGGAINIRAFPYRPNFEASAQVGGGAYGTRRFTAEINSGLLNDRYVLFGRLSRLESDGYRDWSWTEFWRFFVGITRYGDRSTLTLQAYGGPQRDGLAYSGIPKAANKKAIDDGYGGLIDRTYNYSSFERAIEDFHQPHVELHHTYDLSSEWRFSQAAFWVKGKGFFDFGGTFRSANYLRLPEDFVDPSLRSAPLYISRPDVQVQFRAFLDQWQIGWMPRLTHTTQSSTTTYGLEARLHRSLRWGRIQEADGVPEDLVGSGNDVRVYSFRGEKQIFAAYVSHLRRISELWALQADAQITTRRYRISDEAFFGTAFTKPYAFINPRLGLTFRPEQAVSAYASIALASREPRMKSLYDGEEAGEGFLPRFEVNDDGSLDTDRPLVTPEHLLDLEIGTTWKGERFRLSGNVFLMDFRDELVPSGGLDQYGVPRTGNADHTRHSGLELEGAVHLLEGLDVAGNLTFSRNRFIDFTEFVTQPDFTILPLDRSGNEIAGFPVRSGNARLSYTSGGFSGLIMATMVGRQNIDNGNGTDATGADLTVDAFVLLDASMSYSFGTGSALNGLRIALDVNNLADSKVLSYGQVSFGSPEYFPAATRHAFLSLKYTVR